MSLEQPSYVIPAGVEPSELLRAVDRRFPCRRTSRPPRRRLYLDSFDGRLWRRGARLAAEPEAAAWCLSLRQPDAPPLRERMAGPPRWPEELPAGRLRDLLAEALEMRCLLPLVEVELEGEELAVLDRREKTVARLVLELAMAREPEGAEAGRSLAPVLRLRPVRGYREARDELRALLGGELGLEAKAHDLLAAALEAVGREPGGYSSKLKIELDPSLEAAEATKVVYLSLLETLLANEPGVRRDLDSEFLHDFRVAVRRTRSGLSQVKGVFPAWAVERFKAEFSWLGKATGPTRDLDVYLLKMGDYRAALPEAVRADLEPLAGFLRERQRAEQARLVEALDSERYRALIDQWRRFLTEPGAEGGPNAARPILEVASERIWRVYRRIYKRGRKIEDSSPADDLHALRIECKKLRYLLEFFRSLYPAGRVDPLIKALKKLQDNLGDFNDFEVQQEHLARYAREMATAGRAPAATLMAMGRLVAHLEAGQERERRRFARRFDSFAARDNRERFRRLFGSG